MDWIKKNPAQASLAGVAILSLAVTGFLYTKVSGFSSTFESVRGMGIASGKVEKPDTAWLDEARKAIETPAEWKPPATTEQLFSSELFVQQEGKLLKPEGRSFNPPVPNAWLKKAQLDFLNRKVLSEDPDGDGFTTIEEWNGLDTLSHLDAIGQPVMGPDGQPLPDDSTNPTDKASHPPFHTKLKLTDIRYIPFRLRFMSFDENPKKKDDVTVQINTIDAGGKTYFLTMGVDIPKTKYMVVRFEKKEEPGKDGTKKDVSVLTVKNKETGAEIALPIGKVVDSPESYPIFEYVWLPESDPKRKFSVQRGGTFALPPENDKLFKLLEISAPAEAKSATLEYPDGSKKTLKQTP